nr:MAG TPA: hypothetical protein [Caudoviricetes sp.]
MFFLRNKTLNISCLQAKTSVFLWAFSPFLKLYFPPIYVQKISFKARFK